MTDDAVEPDWEALGGDAVMRPLLADFYRRIGASAIRGLFPSDLGETERKQYAFQSEFWGGPARYTPWRGHPRLRARHLPFPITEGDAGVWMACMRAAVEDSAMPPSLRPPFLHRLHLTARAMINRSGDRADPA